MAGMFSKPLNLFFLVCGISHCNTLADKASPIISLVVQSMNLVHMFLEEYKENSMLQTMFKICLYTSTLTQLMHTAYSYLYKKSYLSIINRIQAGNKELGIQNSKKIEVILFASMTSLVTMVITIWWSASSSVLLMLSPLTHIIFLTAPIVQQVVLADGLTRQFLTINYKLEGFFEGFTSILFHRGSQIDLIFKSLSELHVIVVDTNSYYFLRNLLGTTATVSMTVLTLYSCIDYIDNGGSLFYLLMEVSALITYLSLLVAQVMTCGCCAQEAARSAMLAHRLLHPDSPRPLWQQVRLFSALPPPVQFSVGGVFSLDRALLTKLAVSALSYLSIAVQLRDVRLIGSNTLPAGNGTVTSPAW